MNDRLTIESLAIGVAHAVYRNTDVEDFHAEGRIMDQTLYDDVYKTVSEKVAVLIKSLHLLICAHKNGLPAVKTQKNVPTDELSFFQDVLFGIMCGINWDAPREIDLQEGDDIAAFLLGGEFLKYCDGTHIFDDTVMKPINKDIVDRAYCILKHCMLEN